MSSLFLIGIGTNRYSASILLSSALVSNCRALPFMENCIAVSTFSESRLPYTQCRVLVVEAMVAAAPTDF